MSVPKPIFVSAFVLTILAAPAARAEDAQAPRVYDTAGRVRFGASALAMQAPRGDGVDPMLGAIIELRYQRAHVAIALDARAASSSNGLTERQFQAGGIGAKYFLFASGASPYIGAGLAYSSIWIASGTPPGILIPEIQAGFSGTASGPGAFGEIGFEILRTRLLHLHAAIRVDAPFYSVPRHWLVMPTDERVYAAPVSLAIGFTI